MRIVVVGSSVMVDVDQSYLGHEATSLEDEVLLVKESYVLGIDPRRNVLDKGKLIVDIEEVGMDLGSVIVAMAVDVVAIVVYTFMLVEIIGINVPTIVGSLGIQVAVINENEISYGISKS